MSARKKKTIIIISVVAVIIAAVIIWFEIPRIEVRSYIKDNLPEGHYTLYLNYGDFVTFNSTDNQAIDRIWHVYDKDRNVHFNVAQDNREDDIETAHSTGNKEHHFRNNYAMNFTGRYWSSLIYDEENKYQTKLSVQFVPNENSRNHEILAMSALYGEFASREELDALFDDLNVAAQFFDKKNVPLSYGFFQFRYTNYTHYKNIDEYSYLMYGRLDDVETARTEAYNKMIDIGMEYNDKDILSQFTEQELNAYVPSEERIGNIYEE